MHQTHGDTRSQRGNILFIILLAVVLFAALSYAVTSSMRGGGNDASSENNKATTADIMNWLSLVDNGYSRMRLTTGYRAEQISFYLVVRRFDGSLIGLTNNPACSSSACQLFNPLGGGVTPRDFETYSLGASEVNGSPSPLATGPGHPNFAPFAWPGAGTAANDIVMMIGYLKPAICEEIAARTGTITSWTRTGSFADATNPSTWDTSGVYAPTTNTAMFYGTRLVPYKNPSQNFCSVYQLLLER